MRTNSQAYRQKQPGKGALTKALSGPTLTSRVSVLRLGGVGRAVYRCGDREFCAAEPARQRAYALAKTPGFTISQHARRKVEALFAELKNQVGLRRLRLRRMRFVREQFYLAATVQNLKRLVRFLSRKPLPEIATA